jgi:succinate dehydrogenase/fumarate reductase flavoprotein subunit
MEFYQIGFGITHPVRQVMFEGRLLHCEPTLLNGHCQSFLEKYLPAHVSREDCLKARSNHMPFSIRDDSMYLDIATHCEILAERGTLRDSVVADFRRLGRESLCENPIAARCYEGILEKGLDITADPVEITLHVQALNGGVRIDSRAQTDVPGLFAAGEVAAGPHGADRLGGNMMPATQVFGARAGRFAAERAASVKAARGDLRPHRELLELLDEWAVAAGSSTPEDSPLSHAKRLVAMSMWRNAVVARTEQGLTDTERVLGDVEEALERAVPGEDGDARTFFDLRSMTMVGQAILAACKLRKESRGSHHRLDFPETSNDQYCRPIRVDLKGGEISAEIASW